MAPAITSPARLLEGHSSVPFDGEKHVATIMFSLGRAEVSEGETIRVVGSHLALGAWDPEYGLPLATHDGIYPSWKATLPLRTPDGNPSTFCLEYRYVKRTALGKFLWEDIAANRSAVVDMDHRGKELLVQDALFGDLNGSPPKRLSSGEEPSSRVSGEGRTAPLDNRVSANMLLSSALHLAGARSAGMFGAAYEIVDDHPIARGAFALVWRCRLRKATSGMLYVVKCIERARLQKVDKKNLFGADGRDGEIRLHSKIIHPNVVRLISVFEEPEVVSVVLESCAGGDLFEHIRAHKRATDGGVGEAGAIACMRQLLGALTFLHTASIVHRDVKSENVLLVEVGLPLVKTTCKLGDFGFAVCLHQVKGGKLYTIMGSPSTVAPEVLQKKSYGTPADLWSAGVVFYNLLAATQPFKAKSNAPKDIMKKVKAGAFSLEGPLWETVDDEAKDLLRSLMCTRVEERLRAPQALMHGFLRLPEVENPQASDYASAESGSGGSGETRTSKPRVVARSRGRSGLSNKTCDMPPPISRSITTESIAEDAVSRAEDVSQCDTDFGDSDRHFQELPASLPYEGARTSRCPSVATDASAPDSDYGLSEWQISYARRFSNAGQSARRGEDGDAAALVGSEHPDAACTPTGGNSPPYLRPHFPTRASRLTSAASDTTAHSDAFGLADEQLRYRGVSESSVTKGAHRRTSNLDPVLLAKHTQLMREQAALDVLGSRLQERHQPSQPCTSVCETEEEDDAGGEEALDPFIYRRRRITDVYSKEYSQQYLEQDHGKARACCGCSYPAEKDRPWWHRWFF